ncbi:dimethylamine monooxygenase subunit DmmA family protein [Gordonia sp. NPDC058843]|uniref:dimethylamine monooxygenase subunit DmmA family protein n=1 Tax=Gordonia sp. NPDC058843 TaxID=3346648 RepID=UPI0036CBB4BE
MSQIAYSSVPPWARPGGPDAPTAPATTGSSYVLVGVGDVADNLGRWEAELPPRATTRIHGDADSVAGLLRTALAEAVVGVRVWIVADAGAALALRAVALGAGLEDDEIEVVPAPPADRNPVEIFCAHCRSITRITAAVDDIVPCAGCRRDLLVYHHVSRRTGHFLGFMVDAETAGADSAMSHSN